MLSLDNPAGRLHAILAPVAKLGTPSVVRARTLWAEWLRVDPDDDAAIFERLHFVYTLPGKIRYEMSEIAHINADKYLKRLKELEDAFAATSLEDSLESLARATTQNLLDELEICNDTLSQFRPEPVLPPTMDEDRLLDDVRKLLDEVFVAEISADLKQYLSNSLREMAAALRAYSAAGSEPLLKAIDRSIGGIARRPDLQREAHNSSVTRKFLNMVGHVAAVLTIASSSMQLSDGLFGQPDELTVRVDVDISGEPEQSDGSGDAREDPNPERKAEPRSR